MVVRVVEEQLFRAARPHDEPSAHQLVDGFPDVLFYFSYGIHPASGREYHLEGNIDFEERVDVVRRFHLDPLEFEQHLGIGSYSRST